MQLYMSQARVSRTARRWAWLNRPMWSPDNPIWSLDNPVKRYLRNRPVWDLPVMPRGRVMRRLKRLVPRPAI